MKEENAKRHVLNKSLKLLEQANKAFIALQKNNDEEILHDFRVAVRRMRSYFQTYGKFVKLTDSHIELLADLACTSNSVRDFEVFSHWLYQLNSMSEIASSLQLLIDYVAQQLASSRQIIISEYAKTWPGIYKEIRTALKNMDKFKKKNKQTDVVVHENIAAALSRVKRRWKKYRNTQIETELHRTRIAIKKLRYLIEIDKQILPELKPQIKQLATYQDQFGALNDLTQFSRILNELKLKKINGFNDEESQQHCFEHLNEYLAEQREMLINKFHDAANLDQFDRKIREIEKIL